MTPSAAAMAKLERWNAVSDQLERPRWCPYCDGMEILFDGWRIRSASILDEESTVYLPVVRCRRVKCRGCEVSWTLRPEGLLAHRHYQGCVVSSAVSEYLFEKDATLSAIADRIDCARRTVGRWVVWISALAEPSALSARVVEASGVPVVPPVPPVAREAAKCASMLTRQVLATAALVLGLLGVLGEALGCEPPALSSVLKRFVGERSRAWTGAQCSIPEFARRPPWGYGGIPIM
jgi:hypothetical protein